MDFKIEIETGTAKGTMTFDKQDNIINNIYLSLMIPKGAFFLNPDFGSKIHLLQRAKNVSNIETIAKNYIEEALKWMLEAGRIKNLQINTEKEQERLKIEVIAENNMEQVNFTTFLEVI
ncbi:MAG: phage GP46 family protein [Thermoplasmata archaeon]